MSEWHKLLLRLCNTAEIVAGNDDITRGEKRELFKLAADVKLEVIKQVNAAKLTSKQEDR